MEIKGKMIDRRDERREVPPHMVSTSFVELQLDGKDVLTREAFAVETVDSTPAWRAVSNPAVRTQKEDVRHDPTRRGPTIKIPAKPKVSDVTTESKKVSEQKGREMEGGKKSTAPKPYESRAPQHSTPPTQNTRGGVEKKEKGEVGGKGHSTYHFTSTVQEKVDLSAVEARLLDETMITMTVGQFLGCSPEFQKRMANMTKTRREYTDKMVVANRVETFDEDLCPCGCAELKTEGVSAGEEIEYSGSKVHVEYDTDVMTEDAIEVRYASAVKLHKHPVPLFAMVTGKFEGTFGGIKTVFMVDTGSELNLCPGYLYEKTQLSLDLDGTRWSLKGIHGDPVRLKGCARDVSVRIGGHAFDHHFFVNGAVRGSEGTGDVILGQPWLQWYTACIQYDRSGGMTMRVWQDGYHGDRATLSVPLTAPNEVRNKESLEVMGHTKCRRHPTVEDAEDEDSGN